MSNLHLVMKGRCCHILKCLLTGQNVNVYTYHLRLGKALRHHQGYQAGACTDIQYPLPSLGPCPE